MKALDCVVVIVLAGGCTAAATPEQDPQPGSSTEALSAEHCGAAGPSLEHLGTMIFFDTNLSVESNQSCATCHGASVGWTGPDEAINQSGSVYEGSAGGVYGNRKPPSAAYAARAPVFTYSESAGFMGGNFTDGRATGWDLGTPVRDQARGPFLNPVEQSLPDAATLVQRVCAAHYGHMLTRLFGSEACSDDDLGYASIAMAVAAFEASSAVSPYSSKYDAAIAGEEPLGELEQQGLELFNGKALCSQCHSTTSEDGGPAVFSDFGYDNIGVPKNPANPFYEMGPDINPEGPDWIDPGLQAFLTGLSADDTWRVAPYVPQAMLALTSSELAEMAADNAGKHRVPVLRNVDRRPSPGFAKAYAHNGYFKSLEGLVHFYNTRDVLPVCTEALDEPTAMAQGCWPAPEVADNIDPRVGNLQLTADEEAALVAFLSALSDQSTGGCGGPMGPMHGRQHRMR